MVTLRRTHFWSFSSLLDSLQCVPHSLSLQVELWSFLDNVLANFNFFTHLILYGTLCICVMPESDIAV